MDNRDHLQEGQVEEQGGASGAGVVKVRNF